MVFDAISGMLIMDPDNHFLYIQKAFSEDVYPKIGKGGYVMAYKYDDYGIIDRDGELHSLNGDLSTLPGLSELSFMGFGSGYLLETDQHLSLGHHSDSIANIRTLDGKQQMSTAKRTPNTHVMSDTLASDTIIDNFHLYVARVFDIITVE